MRDAFRVFSQRTAEWVGTPSAFMSILNTQNRDARAIHLKLDELLRGVTGARTAMVAPEKNSADDELAELQAEFDRRHRRLSGRGRPPTDEAPGSMPQ